MTPNRDDVLLDDVPNLLPNKLDSVHVEVGHLDQPLQTKDARIRWVIELLPEIFINLVIISFFNFSPYTQLESYPILINNNA